MATTTLTKTRMISGVWEGVLTCEGDTPPEIVVSNMDRVVDGVSVKSSEGDGGWLVHVPIPADHLSDGVTTFVIRDARTDETLNSFALFAGEALSEDIRAEMSLMREELDMLKRAFRRHCVETIVTD